MPEMHLRLLHLRIALLDHLQFFLQILKKESKTLKKEESHNLFIRRTR